MITYSIIQKSQIEGASRLDAEYYDPELLKLMEKQSQYESGVHTLGEICEKIDVGFVGPMAHSYVAEGIPLIQTQNVNEFFLDYTNLTYIGEWFHYKLKNSQIVNGDILIARSGSIGKAAIITKDDPQPLNSSDVIIIRTKPAINKYFLCAYINCKFGQVQIKRFSSGGLQEHVNLSSLETLSVPLFDQNVQVLVAEKVSEGIGLLRKSNEYYSKAQNLLLEKLGLENFIPEDDLSYIVRFSDIKYAHRVDSDYFQPKYKRILSQIRSYNVRLLGNLVSMKKGVEPGSDAYQDEGKLFIRVSSITKHGIIDKDQKYLSNELYQDLRKSYEPKMGEILLTKDATPGIAYVLKEPLDGIIAGGIIRLKLKKEVEAEYLALCINSIIGQMQIERDAGGSVIVHWKPEQIKNLQVPILPKNSQQKIADLVHQSHEARKKSKELLEQAKKEVEKLIEGKN